MEEIKVNYTREELIEICEKAIVQEKDWHDRDSESSQRNVGECWALLKAGCDYEITDDTGKNTILLCVYSKGFMWFEDWGEDRDNSKEKHRYYLPTPKSLEEANGKDWY